MSRASSPDRGDARRHPDENRDIDIRSCCLCSPKRGTMRLGALTGGDERFPRHRFRHRSPQGCAGHGVRRLPAPASTARISSPPPSPRRRGGGRAPPRRSSRGESTSPPRSRARFARLAARFFAFSGTVVAVTGTNGKTSNVELCRQLWRMAGHRSASHRHARRDHRRRPGDDRPHHARHRHLPVQHGRARADGDHPCRLRGVEPRPRPVSHRRAAGHAAGLHQPSAATISTIT